MEDRPLLPAPRPPRDIRRSWVAFLGGAGFVALSIAIAIVLWQYFGRSDLPLSAAELTEAEALLDELGFPPGAVDGAIDGESRSAIRDFQLTAGLDVDGLPSVALLDELRAAKAELSGN